VGKYGRNERSIAVLHQYNEQYQIAVYIFCFSLAFFGFLPGGAGILFTDTLELV
jgi:hypothetical protein